MKPTNLKMKRMFIINSNIYWVNCLGGENVLEDRIERKSGNEMREKIESLLSILRNKKTVIINKNWQLFQFFSSFLRIFFVKISYFCFISIITTTYCACNMVRNVIIIIGKERGLIIISLCLHWMCKDNEDLNWKLNGQRKG